MIAQIKLKNYEILTSDVDISILKSFNLDKSDIDCLEGTRDKHSGKIKIGLTQGYVLLHKLGDILGKFYMNNEKLIQNTIQFRNNSILAHGLMSLNEKQFLEFQKIVNDASGMLNKNMDSFVNETIFPQFEL